MEKSVLIVEDESSIREVVGIHLRKAGFQVTDVSTGEEGLVEFGRKGFDVVLLDIMLPGMSGYEVCKEIRSQSKETGIIMITAKTQERDKVSGLALGADDYITKPFSISELLARVEAVYRRVEMFKEDSAGKKELTSGPFILRLGSKELLKNGEIIDLSPVEFSIMELFLKNVGVALSREKILSSVWGDNFFSDIKIVDVNIRRLRVKVEEDSSTPKYIQTVWGQGYRFGSGGEG